MPAGEGAWGRGAGESPPNGQLPPGAGQVLDALMLLAALLGLAHAAARLSCLFLLLPLAFACSHLAGR